MSTVETDEEYSTTNNIMTGIVVTIIVVCALSLIWAGGTIVFDMIQGAKQ